VLFIYIVGNTRSKIKVLFIYIVGRERRMRQTVQRERERERETKDRTVANDDGDNRQGNEFHES
jgi:hypothetical protein